MTIRDKALLHRRWNPSRLAGRYVDAAGCRLTFGRWDGAELQDVPSGYLRWCLNTLDLSDYERRVIEVRLSQEPFKSSFLGAKKSFFLESVPTGGVSRQ